MSRTSISYVAQNNIISEQLAEKEVDFLGNDSE